MSLTPMKLNILITAATGFRDFQSRTDTPLEEVISKATIQLDAVAAKSFEELQARQLSDHQALFNRVSLRLGPAAASMRNQQTSASKK